MEIFKTGNEYLDIYNEKGEKTGKIISRGTPIKNGEFSLSVHLFIYNSKGMFLVQKRSKSKRSLPGIWSITCGAVVSGEDSLSAGMREAREELGIFLEPSSFDYIKRIKRKHSFIDIYFIKYNFEIQSLILQKEEVETVKTSSPKELLQMLNSTSNVNSSYSAAVARAMKERGLI